MNIKTFIESIKRNQFRSDSRKLSESLSTLKKISKATEFDLVNYGITQENIDNLINDVKAHLENNILELTKIQNELESGK